MRVVAAAAVVLGLGVLLPAAASAEPRIQSERFDDWFYRCVTPEAGKISPSPKLNAKSSKSRKPNKARKPSTC